MLKPISYAALTLLISLSFSTAVFADFEFIEEFQLGGSATYVDVHFDGEDWFFTKFDGSVERRDSSFNFIEDLIFPLPFFGNGRSIVVDRLNGNYLYLSATTRDLTEFTPAFELVHQYDANTDGLAVGGLVLDPITNTTFSVGTSTGLIRHYTREGVVLSEFNVSPPGEAYNALTIDVVNRTLLLSDPGFAGGDRVFEYTFDGVFVGFAFEGSLQATFSNGIYYDSDTARLYAVDAVGNLAIWEDKSRLGSGGFVPPANYSVVRGIELNGSIQAFADSDDSRSNYNPGFTINNTEAPVWLEFEANVSQASAFLVESNAGTPGLEYTVQAFNWTTMTYDTIGTVTESFSNDQVTSHPIVAADHIDSGGDVNSRVGWRVVGFTINFPWEVNVDQVGWNQ